MLVLGLYGLFGTCAASTDIGEDSSEYPTKFLDCTLNEYVLPLVRVIPVVENCFGKTPVAKTSHVPYDLSHITLQSITGVPPQLSPSLQVIPTKSLLVTVSFVRAIGLSGSSQIKALPPVSEVSESPQKFVATTQTTTVFP